ncbi:type IV pilus modification PilV family protein [Baaleninema simplex]|uniref:type IV pilus modification PilV family protein n=1 Tax=Baaleninema simplex TaxID=2862350 RepID=UPI00034C120E|nr:type II secretion system protein [Baaleninema simplex]
MKSFYALLQQYRQLNRQLEGSEKGLTLVEGLVAILVVSAVTVSITPAIFLAVATRVQNRRAEQAVQLAHGQIDQIRVLIEQGLSSQEDIDRLPALVSGDDARSVAAPSNEYGQLQSTNYECSDYDKNGAPQIPAETALPVDVNGDCEADFLVQSFRIKQVTSELNSEDETLNVPTVFHMGVRVYYKNANLGNLNTTEASLILTTGEGQQTQYPLAVMYTTLSQSDVQTSLDKYEEFLE